MKATLIFHKRQEAYGGIVEMVIWRLPRTDPDRPHGLKYRLYFGRDGQRLVGYDNERGKGDHRHYESHEEPYHFVSLERLIRDFLDDVTRIGG
ncbi:MAG: DUF6516 family protein [Chromatiales bacterium]|jgi:hypothetical protein|nr:DUF6516 family protein [Chromatiales bacterium]MDX9767484.1 DUF6516 family protein [Ectothiorhodospiraceae bacterium]